MGVAVRNRARQARQFEQVDPRIRVLENELMMRLVPNVKATARLRRRDAGGRQEKHASEQGIPHGAILGKHSSLSEVTSGRGLPRGTVSRSRFIQVCFGPRTMNAAVSAYLLAIFTIDNWDLRSPKTWHSSSKRAKIRALSRLLDFHATFACTTPAALPCE